MTIVQRFHCDLRFSIAAIALMLSIEVQA